MKKQKILAVLLLTLLLSACGGQPAQETKKADNVVQEIFLTGQLEYARENGITLLEFSQQKKLANWLEKHYIGKDISGDAVYLKEKGGLFGKRLERTMDPGSIWYVGELKDNQPDGIGIVYVNDPMTTHFTGTSTSCIQYIGSFEKGRCSGYGLLFNVPDEEDLGIAAALALAPDPESDAFAQLYAAGVNYVTYEGMFEKGEQSGQGNRYVTMTTLASAWIEDLEGEFADGVRYYLTEVGEFSGERPDGEVRMYVDGLLCYDGGMKDGDYSGEGTLYYENGQIRYQGGFKQGEYHGKGTLYAQDGSVVYSGKWRFGDYD